MIQNIEKLKVETLALIKSLGTGEYEDGSSNREGYTYQPIPVDCFSDVKYHKEPSEWGYVKSLFENWDGKTVFDFGCNIGYYVLSLTSLGAVCTGIEKSETNLKIAKNLAKIVGYTIEFDKNFEKYSQKKYDVLLCMNVFHWVVKQNGIDSAIGILKKLDVMCDVMFFSVPHGKNQSMARLDMWNTKEETEEFLLKNTNKKIANSFLVDAQRKKRWLFILK